jgi:hypothetical protein
MNKFAVFTVLATTLAFASIASAGPTATRGAHQGRKAHIGFGTNQSYALTGQMSRSAVRDADFARHLDRVKLIRRGGRAGH